MDNTTGTYISRPINAINILIGLATNDVTNEVTCSEMPALRQTRFLELAF